MEGLKRSNEDQSNPTVNTWRRLDLEDMDVEGPRGPDGLPYEEAFPNLNESNQEEVTVASSRSSTDDARSSDDYRQNEIGSGSEEDAYVPEMNDDEFRVNPLLIPNVIELILKKLPAKDVETCRLVSRTWDAEACTVLRNKRIVVFVDPDGVKVYNNAMRDTAKFPHAHFEFCIPDITGFVDEDLREFWEKFGQHVKSLEFRQSHLFWRDFFEVLENKVPNLEKLTLRHLPRNVLRSPVVRTELHQIRSVKVLRITSLPAATAFASERLTDTLKAFPQLEAIEFLRIKQATVRSRVSNVIIEVLQKPELSLSNLRSINLNLEMTSESLDAIASKRFPLQRLSITLANGTKASSFKNLVCALRPTLTELKVSYPDTYSNFQTFLTQNKSMHPDECVQLLSNLKSLHMVNFKGSINFVQNLPALDSLEFTTNDLPKCIPFGFKQIGSSNAFFRYNQDHQLKSLKVVSSSPSSPQLAETLMLDSVSRCFPFLNCLYLDGIDDDGLGVIYRNLPFLSDVEFREAKCTDQGLTGIPLEICNDMLETSTFIIVQAEKYRRDLFIGSLQFLRKLTVIAPKISDASIALGLVDCKNMRELKVGSGLISDTGIIFITDRFCKQLDLFDVTECSEITEQSKFYAREKLTGKLKVSDSSQDDPVQPKPPAKDEPAAVNRDRGIVISKTKTAGLSLSLSSSISAKYVVQDTEFFEEVSDEELRERAHNAPLIAPAFHADRRNRFRMMRIRNALRRNVEFMRSLQRMGVQQFQRLFRVELQENRVRMRNENPAEEDELRLLLADREDFANGDAVAVGAGDDFIGNRNIANVVVGDRDGQDDDWADDDGVLAVGEAEPVPNRLPEIHLAEIYRLGLRLDDVEFWLLNRPLFEGEENENGNVRPAGLGGMRLFPGEALEFFRADAIREFPDEDVIDMEAIRQVVMNALEEDVAFEG